MNVNKDKQIRVKANTLKLVRIFSGQMQIATGENITDDDAIYELFKLYRPDIIEILKEIEEKQSKE
jgi:hypothetical protein